MMPAAAASTESVSQRRRVVAFIRSISIRRQQSSRPKFQQRQYSLPADGMIVPAQPVGQELTMKLGNTTSNPHPPDAARGRNEQHASSGVHVVNQVKAESDKEMSPPVDVDKRVLVTSTSRDTAGGVEQRTDADTGAAQKERPATSKFHSFSTGVNTREEECSAPRGVRNKLQRAKHRTLRSIRAAIPRSKDRDSKREEPIQKASVTQLPIPSSIGDEPPDSKTMEDEEKEIPGAAALYAEGNQRKTTNVRDAEQTAKESEEIEKLRRDLSESHYQISELQQRCEAQSRDLENSNSFLNTADKSSDSDIIYALQRVNAEVQQNTTYMADCLAEDLEFSNVTTNLTEEQNLAVQRASGHIGQALVKSLGTKTPENLPMLLQIAFQAYLASALCQTASSWAFEPAHNAFIDGIYQRLRRVEAQAISGRWRSLARVHIVHNWISDPGSLVKGIVAGLSDILLAAGCTATQSDVISKVTSKFEGKITLLVELAGRLNKLFDEVISSDFEVFLVRPGEKFEGKKMEDTDGDEVGIQEGPVLCATHLGLIKRLPAGTLWEKGRKQKVMVLKAKVLLEAFLNTED